MSRRTRWAVLAVGAVFGFLLTASGFGDYETIHRGLLLQDGYIYLTMGSAVGTAFAGIALLRRRGRTASGAPLRLPRKRAERRHVYGGAVFGLGFGVGATCPGITVAMTTTGGLYGLVVLVGLLGGLRLRGWVEQRAARSLSTEPMLPAARPVVSARRLSDVVPE